MCLRKVPNALAVIEEWDRQTAAKEGKSLKWEPSRASTELYEQLEGFGTTSLGWKSLKLVVRAHAFCLLTAAVAEGLFEPSFVRLLADLCISLECRAEAGRLVSSLRFPLTAPCGSSITLLESSAIQPLGAILRSLQNQGTIGPSWGCLSTLIKEKKLSLSWLTSRAFQSVWMRGIEILLRRRTPVAPVIDFMCTAIDQLLLQDEKATKTKGDTEDETLINVLAAVAAATWTLGTGVNSSDQWEFYAIRRLLFTLESCMLKQESRRDAFRSKGLLTVVLARFIASGMIDKNVVSFTTKKHAIDDCLKLLTHNIEDKQVACRATTSYLKFDGLVSDGAFVLAQRTRDLRDVAFAERFPVAGKGTLETSTIFSGWCWEEGIGEWVLPSPGQKRRIELKQQNCRQNGTRYQTSEDRQSDSRARTRSLTGTRVGYGNSFECVSDEASSSMGSERGAENRNETDDTDNEDENDTSVTSFTDDFVRDNQDSGDELGDYFSPNTVSEREHNHSIGKGSKNSSSINTHIRTRYVKKVTRLDIARIWQTTRLHGGGPGVSAVGQVEDDTDDELSLLCTDSDVM
ncbi:hypothetical protein FLONG3_7696 [Fusarium longipes]|uniref:Uncharacterized protein n=1 Tax=Fusarium longipes TaxID=694270 RepID=A0A395SBG4_9HYPO|nr:hypothetical protein FLONG3_7696 [Fusarium longipes]